VILDAVAGCVVGAQALPRGRSRPLQASEKGDDAVTAGAPEKINTLDGRKPFPMAREIATPPGGSLSMRASAVNPLQLAGKVGVGLLPRVAELIDQFTLGSRIDMIG
jgi:hypothetical protein